MRQMHKREGRHTRCGIPPDGNNAAAKICSLPGDGFLCHRPEGRSACGTIGEGRFCGDAQSPLPTADGRRCQRQMRRSGSPASTGAPGRPCGPARPSQAAASLDPGGGRQRERPAGAVRDRLELWSGPGWRQGVRGAIPPGQWANSALPRTGRPPCPPGTRRHAAVGCIGRF